MTVMRLAYQGRGALPRPGLPIPPPQRDLERDDILTYSGAGYGPTALAEDPLFVGPSDARWPRRAELNNLARRPYCTRDAMFGSAAWQAKIDAFVAACVATGLYTVAIETADPETTVPGI